MVLGKRGQKRNGLSEEWWCKNMVKQVRIQCCCPEPVGIRRKWSRCRNTELGVKMRSWGKRVNWCGVGFLVQLRKVQLKNQDNRNPELNGAIAVVQVQMQNQDSKDMVLLCALGAGAKVNVTGKIESRSQDKKVYRVAELEQKEYRVVELPRASI